MASLFFFVTKKKVGTLQPCQDYQDLNNNPKQITPKTLLSMGF
uniref:Putative reverse transcriptase n=1 Tax=Moniliophthora roreri TaxID=221103 RepID=A0A0W0FB03_MONRR